MQCETKEYKSRHPACPCIDRHRAACCGIGYSDGMDPDHVLRHAPLPFSASLAVACAECGPAYSASSSVVVQTKRECVQWLGDLE